MLRISRLTDYSIVLLRQMLAKNSSESSALSASSLANEAGLPLPTVSKLLKLMTKKGLITAKRGVSGGYFLSSKPGQLSLLELIELFEGPTGITDCLIDGIKPCHIDHHCAQKSGWHLVNIRIKAVLKSILLKDFLGSANNG